MLKLRYSSDMNILVWNYRNGPIGIWFGLLDSTAFWANILCDVEKSFPVRFLLGLPSVSFSITWRYSQYHSFYVTGIDFSQKFKRAIKCEDFWNVITMFSKSDLNLKWMMFVHKSVSCNIDCYWQKTHSLNKIRIEYYIIYGLVETYRTVKE